MRDGEDSDILVLGGKLQATGGIETHIYQFCQQMALMGAKTILVSTAVVAFPSEKKAKLRVGGVRVVEYEGSATPRGVLSYLMCLRFLWGQRGRCRVLYTNGISRFALYSAKIVRPTIWVHHHHSDAQRAIFNTWSACYKRLLRSATFVICCTASHREFLADALNRRDSVLFLPYLKAEPAQFPGTFRPRSKMPVCLGFFGRLRKEKGVPVLLRIADWMGQNQFECRLHGDDCETLVPASLPKSIRWGGPYDAQTDLDRLMSEIDIVVIPSVGAEGLPIVLSEAISRGVPVVAFDGGGLKDMKCFHKGVLIVKEGEENLKGALLEMRDRLRDGSLSESLIHEYGNHLSNAKTLQWWASIIKR